MKHTPGPWTIDQNDQFIHVIEPISGIGPCSIPLNGGEMREEDIANARLIAAAPELLEKLIELIDVLSRGEMTNVDVHATLTEARELYSKATGGAE